MEELFGVVYVSHHIVHCFFEATFDTGYFCGVCCFCRVLSACRLGHLSGKWLLQANGVEGSVRGDADVDQHVVRDRIGDCGTFYR